LDLEAGSQCNMQVEFRVGFWGG